MGNFGCSEYCRRGMKPPESQTGNFGSTNHYIVVTGGIVLSYMVDENCMIDKYGKYEDYFLPGGGVCL